jgi:diadenylate cyclase
MEWFQRFTAFYNFVRPVIDVGILAFFLYKAYELMARTQAMQLVKGAGLLALIYGVAFIFKLATLQWILQALAPGLFVAVAIVFQPELRKIIIRLGQTEFFHPDQKPRIGQLESVVTAAEILSHEKRGMLVVFPRKVNIKSVIDSGTRLNADISSSLIVTVFEFDTPLHDGAMVIQNSHIVAAGCFLPLSEQQDIRKNFGTRHRASLGMSEQSDAVILVVSEETGAISLAYESKLYYDLSPIEITRKLKELLDQSKTKKSAAVLEQDINAENNSADASVFGNIKSPVGKA